MERRGKQAKIALITNTAHKVDTMLATQTATYHRNGANAFTIQSKVLGK